MCTCRGPHGHSHLLGLLSGWGGGRGGGGGTLLVHLRLLRPLLSGVRESAVRGPGLRPLNLQ
eukprot:5356614-Pyramimonas_sp.AAC.5